MLQIDRNGFYGEESASLNLTSMWKHFGREDKSDRYGQNRDWNIDLIPKFVMADGKLVKILLKTKVARYLEWRWIDGTYVLQMRQAGFFSKGGPAICKVPQNAGEALKSDLMSMLEKRRCQGFLLYVQNLDVNNPATWQGKLNPHKDNFGAIVKFFKLDDNTIDFIGHAIAMYTNDDFLYKPAIEAIEKIKLYMNSVGIFGDSPLIYPIYGLGGIPEGFSRMCAVNGGTFMLNTDIDEILFEDGKVSGIRAGDKITKTQKVICSPSYAIKCGLQDRLQHIGKIVRCICILDHPLPNTKDAPSCQIILPQRQTGRKSDIYVMMVSSVHQVCKKGFYIAIISTNVETSQPEKEIQAGLDLMGNILEKFVQISDIYLPNNSKEDGLYITKSPDAQSHFESLTQDVMDLYEKIEGKPISTDVDMSELEDY